MSTNADLISKLHASATVPNESSRLMDEAADALIAADALRAAAEPILRYVIAARCYYDILGDGSAPGGAHPLSVIGQGRLTWGDVGALADALLQKAGGE